MAGRDNAVSFYARSYLAAERDSSVRKCCCTTLQFKASCIIFCSTGLIFVSEYWHIAGYLVFLGSIGIFTGAFLILLDFTLFLQTKSDRRGRRFGRGDEEGRRDSSIWTTSVHERGRTLSFASAPPDYHTTISQPDSFPLYLQDGVPVTSLPVTVEMDDDDGGCENEVEIEEEDDKLPSYAEIMGESQSPSMN
ncbi:uncharacterized protein LOC100893295 [Strongylocentrotus purpuratus]|uniref:Uncharacterized protein n=1 Tax=Strongylocentrotus purpuratus TaxID=7668 RepID=A0A7M7GHX9_STRPU|nr:uncharacterized protein LOC100893295 [Strongylocentrotus purpuratus]